MFMTCCYMRNDCNFFDCLLHRRTPSLGGGKSSWVQDVLSTLTNSLSSVPTTLQVAMAPRMYTRKFLSNIIGVQ